MNRIIYKHNSHRIDNFTWKFAHIFKCTPVSISVKFLLSSSKLNVQSLNKPNPIQTLYILTYLIQNYFLCLGRHDFNKQRSYIGRQASCLIHHFKSLASGRWVNEFKNVIPKLMLRINFMTCVIPLDHKLGDMPTAICLALRCMGLLPDMYNWGLWLRRECRERFPRPRWLTIPWRTCRDACRDR